MICKNCNQRFGDILTKCPHCGTIVTEEERAAALDGNTLPKFYALNKIMKFLSGSILLLVVGWFLIDTVMLLTGLHFYEHTQYSLYLPRIIYREFATLKVLDVCFGLIAFCISGFSLWVGYSFLMGNKRAKILVPLLPLIGILYNSVYSVLLVNIAPDVSFSIINRAIDIQINMFAAQMHVVFIYGLVSIFLLVSFILFLVYFIFFRKQFAE